MSRFINLTGWVFGKLTVLERDIEYQIRKNNKILYWKCKCECGNIVTVSGDNLRRGNTKSCGCLHNEIVSENLLKDLKGVKFGRLTVLERVANINNKTYWKCVCECGNIIIVNSSNLLQFHTKSCGCLHNEIVSEKFSNDLKGERFGKLVVIDKALKPQEIDNSKGAYWKCICDCGNIIVVLGSNLTCGNTKSCGCVNSYGELLIGKILKHNNILFKHQYKFEDCISPSGKQYRFDFGILNKESELQYLIEFDGIQHFNYNSTGWNTEENFKNVRMHDLLKNKYCFDNNISLIRIPYIIINHMSINDLMLHNSDYILKKENEYLYFKNYE